jgi:Fibronectin type III domain
MRHGKELVAMTKRRRTPGIALIGALTLAVGIAAVARSSPGPPAHDSAKPMRLEQATMIVEFNDTADDAGIQVFLDHEPWSSMKVTAPDGRRLLDVHAKGKLKNFGLTELFSETHEPELKELPLDKFKKRFPQGKYRFAGRTVEGRKVVGSARLSHDIPSGPGISTPAPDSTVPRDDAVASWTPALEPGIQIKGYRVIVERENPFRKYEVELPASQTSVTIPPEFLEPGTEYLLEIQTIEESGNQTISEHNFRVG